MKLVILESPYGSPDNVQILKNIEYARACIRDCLKRNESPIASHLLFTQPNILRDSIPEERELGINAGLAWISRSDYSVFYTDLGWSNGMLSALHNHVLKFGYDFKIRALSKDPKIPVTLQEEIEDILISRIQH